MTVEQSGLEQCGAKHHKHSLGLFIITKIGVSVDVQNATNATRKELSNFILATIEYLCYTFN